METLDTTIPLFFCNEALALHETRQYKTKSMSPLLSHMKYCDSEPDGGSFDFVSCKRQLLGIISSKCMTSDDPSDKIGTVAWIVKINVAPIYAITVTGLCKFKLVSVIHRFHFVVGNIELDINKNSEITEEKSQLRENFDKALMKYVSILDPSSSFVKNIEIFMKCLPFHQLLDIVTYYIIPQKEARNKLLEVKEITQRSELLIELMERASSSKQQNQVTVHVERVFPMNRPSGRREEITQLEDQIKEANMPSEADKEAKKLLKQLMSINQISPEHSIIRSYLELLVTLPWNKYATENENIKEAMTILNENNYGQNKIKKRILEYICVKKLTPKQKCPILCFVGPPGVGKTSIVESIAQALGRPFHRMSLGGINDVHDIRGHRRTYVAAMPGRIIQGIQKSKVKNPVFLLDEIDKLGEGRFQGDPNAALLEVLDPEQNTTYTDSYLNLPFDLSKVLFVATANDKLNIPSALQDRMEIISVPGYALVEKMMITKKFLIPKQLVRHGLKNELRFDDETIKKIISEYTSEAGVRELERKIAALCRAFVVDMMMTECDDEGIEDGSDFDDADSENSSNNDDCRRNYDLNYNKIVDDAYIHSVLGPPKYIKDLSLRVFKPGVAVGLAWTPVGGVLMVVEGNFSGGEKTDLVLTGQLGSVLTESAKIALSWITINCHKFDVDPKTLKDRGTLHMHFPSGAIKKDGPSAGVTIVTVVMSLLLDTCVKDDVAMTGEITLSGIVLPVGGIKEKVIAAHTNNFRTVILPIGNKKDEVDIPSSVIEELSIIYVRTIDDVLTHALISKKLKSNL